jgi:dihydroorotate dehydrogenase electron transfer subunit
MLTHPVRREARLLAVEPLGPGLGRVELEGEGLALGVTPGRFAMVGAPGRADCILLRPYSYFTAHGNDRIGLLIKAVGKGTEALLRARAGDRVPVLGPLGSRFPEPPARCWAVAGGVGAAPFGVLQHRPGIDVLFGARTEAESGFATALKGLGASLHLATDDGSAGYHGSVVALLEARLRQGERPDMVYTCGPTGMMAAVARVVRAQGVPCWASLEERMGCGIGVCRGCAHRDAAGGWRCICVDGPVYDARLIFPEAS